MRRKILLLLMLVVFSIPALALDNYNIIWENFIESPEIKGGYFLELSYLGSKYDSYEEYDDGSDPAWIINLLDFINDYHHRAKLSIIASNSTEIYGTLDYVHDYQEYPLMQTFSVGVKQNLINKDIYKIALKGGLSGEVENYNFFGRINAGVLSQYKINDSIDLYNNLALAYDMKEDEYASLTDEVNLFMENGLFYRVDEKNSFKARLNTTAGTERSTSASISLAYQYVINPELSYTLNIINLDQISEDKTDILNLVKYSPTEKTDLYGGIYASLDGYKMFTLAGEHKINEMFSILGKFNYTEEDSSLYLGFKFNI